MPRTIDLSEKLAQLRAFHQQEGRAPSYSEMAQLFGYASKNAVYGPVQKLIELGYLQRSANGRIAFTSKITSQIAMLGSKGLSIRNSEPIHTLRNLAGKFSGLELLCLEYAGFHHHSAKSYAAENQLTRQPPWIRRYLDPNSLAKCV